MEMRGAHIAAFGIAVLATVGLLLCCAVYANRRQAKPEHIELPPQQYDDGSFSCSSVPPLDSPKAKEAAFQMPQMTGRHGLVEVQSAVPEIQVIKPALRSAPVTGLVLELRRHSI